MIYRVSNVASFAYWLANENADTERLISDIRGTGEESEAMRKGTAFHKALENAMFNTEIERVSVDGYTFNFNGDFEISIPPIREWRQSKTYIVDGLPIVISGQIDMLTGKRIDDHKTTETFDAEKYIDGYQWRLYLDIFNCDKFRWNVFECKEVAPFEYDVNAQHTLEQNRYPALPQDCRQMVSEFARFVRTHVEPNQ